MAKKERTCSDCAHLDTATLTCGIGMDMAASRCWMFRQIEEPEEGPIEDAPGQAFMFEIEEVEKK